MNALFVPIVVLGIIFLVMLCNSNKDGYSDPNDAPRREGPDRPSYYRNERRYTNSYHIPADLHNKLTPYMSQHSREDIPDIMDKYNQLPVPDTLLGACKTYAPLCGINPPDCLYLRTLTPSQRKCLYCTTKRNDVYKRCKEAGGSDSTCIQKYIDCQKSCQQS